MTDDRIASLLGWASYVGIIVVACTLWFVFAFDTAGATPAHRCQGVRYLEVDGTLIVQEAGITRRVHGAELERAVVCGWVDP